jgi:hypothetical protein
MIFRVQRTDWLEWHQRYEDPNSGTSQRLRLVQGHISDWLDRREEPLLRVVSVCAGHGLDILGALKGRADAGRIRATLVELDPRNVEVARQNAADVDADVAILEADAGDRSTYRGLVPADLVVLVGVLGNITEDDVENTIRALPELCADGATVIWTRTRKLPDLTPSVRQWLAETGFTERAFHAPDAFHFTVGVHELTAKPRPLAEGGRLFTFVR